MRFRAAEFARSPKKREFVAMCEERCDIDRDYGGKAMKALRGVRRRGCMGNGERTGQGEHGCRKNGPGPVRPLESLFTSDVLAGAPSVVVTVEGFLLLSALIGSFRGTT